MTLSNLALLLASVVMVSPLAGQEPAGGADEVRVELQDGKQLDGTVFDLRRGDLEVRGKFGLKMIPKSSVARWRLREGDGELEPFLVLRSGRNVAGKIDFSAEQGEWLVERPLGTARYPLDEVVRLVQLTGRCSDGAFTPRRGFDRLLAELLVRVRESPDSLRKEVAAELDTIGYFAIPEVEKALAAGEDPGGVLRRFLTRERMRARLPEGVDERLPSFLEDVTGGSEEKRVAALEEAVLEFGEALYPFLGQLLLDDEQPARARAYSVETLQHHNRVADLVAAYRHSTGQAQLALAVALGDLGLLIGVPTLIEALGLENEAARRLAADKLNELTGEAYDFRPEAPPGSNLTAIARYQDWYRDNQEKIEATLLSALTPEEESPVRRKAARFWREGSVAWGERDLTLAQTLFRKAIDEDPTCITPYVCLGIIAYRERNEYEEAKEWFRNALRRSTPDKDREMQRLAYYHLGRIFGFIADYEMARQSLRKAVEIDPNYADAWYDLGDVIYRQALAMPSATAEERKARFEDAAREWERGYESLREYRRNLVLITRDALPSGENLPFSRREHNITLNQLRDSLRRLEGRFAYRLAQVHLALRLDAPALDWIDKAVNVDEEVAEYHSLRAELLARLGRAGDAEAARKRAAELTPAAEAPKRP